MKINDWLTVNVNINGSVDKSTEPKKCLICHAEFVNIRDPNAKLCFRCEDMYLGGDHVQCH